MSLQRKSARGRFFVDGPLAKGASGPGWNARGLDPPHLPGQQDEQEQQDGQSHPERQCRGHAAFGGRLIGGGVGFRATHHVHQGEGQGSEDGGERQSNEDFHVGNYPMSVRGLSWMRILVLLAAVVGVAVTASLGRWQLGRAAQKQAIAQARHDQAAQPELDGRTLAQHAQAPVELEALRYRRLALTGVWLAGHTVYLDNRQMHGRPGFYVLTPLRLQDSDAVVLVQRGWIPRNFQDRTALPALQTPEGPVTVHGQLVPWPSKVYDFGEMETGPMRQNLIFEDYRLQTRLPLLELSVQQSDADSEGLLRAWPEIASGVEKHYGYAFQWFGLSGLIALLYVWFQIVQPRRKNSNR